LITIELNQEKKGSVAWQARLALAGCLGFQAQPAGIGSKRCRCATFDRSV